MTPARSPRTRSTSPRAVATAVATAAVVVLAVTWCAVMVQTPDRDLAHALSTTGLAVLSVLAGGAAAVRAHRERGAARRSWSLLAAAVLSWAGGQSIWWWREMVSGEVVTSYGIADLGYLGLEVFALLAVLVLPLGATGPAARLRGVLDGMLVAGSLALCSWILLLRPLAGTAGSAAELLAGLSYPVLDVVLLTAVVHAIVRARRRGPALPVPLVPLGAGLLAIAVADAWYSSATTRGTYTAGGVLDLGWFAGFAVLLLTALLQRAPRRPTAGPARGARLLGTFGGAVPGAAVVLAAAVTAADVARGAGTGAGTDAVSAWWRTGLLLVLVGRQLVSLRENHVLTRHLEQRVAERTAELLVREARFTALVQHSSDLVAVVDPRGVVSYQSDSSARVLGRPAHELLGRPLGDLMEPATARAFEDALQRVAAEGLPSLELRGTWAHADGRGLVVATTVTNLLHDPAVGGLVLNARDVTEPVRLEEQLTTQAFTDSLTGLHNRALFHDRLQGALARAAGPGASLAVLFLDLDGFKAVNDTLGHTAGDALLVAVAGRVRALVRPGDTVARLGGDEFAVLAQGLAAPGDELVLAQRISEGLRAPFVVGGEVVHIAASTGIATLDPFPASADELLRNADLAMYRAKAERAGGCAVYHPDLHAGLVERVRLEADLWVAVEEEQFFLHYQPLVALDDGRITGVEALVRWRHPERGVVPPDAFIPLAESTGLIRPLGLWVLREACRQAVRWDAELPGVPLLRMSVNLSVQQVRAPGLVEEVAGVLAATGFPADRLTLEVTESVLAEDADRTRAVLGALSATGVALAIDDFGTGYSSLSYLQRFPFDTLKIDRSFVGRMAEDEEGGLVEGIIGLARSLRLETVAEGVEDAAQLAALRRQGCTTGQGYWFSPPVDATAITEMVVAGSTSARPATLQPDPAPGALPDPAPGALPDPVSDPESDPVSDGGGRVGAARARSSSAPMAPVA